MPLPDPTHIRPGPNRLVAFFAVLSMFVSMFNYFWAGNGIHGTEGALLVVVSTVLLSGAALAILYERVSGVLSLVLNALMFLDYLGSVLAAYLLEAWFLVALLALGFIAWVIHFVRPLRPLRPRAVQP